MLSRIKNTRGSLTLEATLVFPIFLALMLVLVNFIKITTTYIAMDHAVSETTKLIATHAYPLKYLNQISLPGQSTNSVSSDLTQRLGMRAVDPFIEQLFNPSVSDIVASKIEEMYPKGAMGISGFQIKQIHIYNPLKNGQAGPMVNHLAIDNADIALVVDYKVQLLVPFFPLEIALSNTAVERAWVEG